MNEEQEIRAAALEIAAMIIGKTNWPHEGGAVISGNQRVKAKDPQSFDEIFTPYRSLALLIERDIHGAKGGETPSSV